MQARISCDVRWQLANEKLDDRYVGPHVGLAKPKAGLYAEDDQAVNKNGAENNKNLKDKVNISQLKSKWGLHLHCEETKSLNNEWGQMIS